MKIPLLDYRKHLFKAFLPFLFTLFHLLIYAENSFAEIGHDSLYSQELQEERHLLISLPDSYHDADMQQQKYPVIYLFDGKENFESVEAMKNYLVRKRFGLMPEVIIVGISNSNRTRDLTPPIQANPKKAATGRTQDFTETAGGLPQFVHFLERELIPQIAEKYRASNYRILIGHSFGGLAATHILMHNTHLFNAYILIDPSYWWDDNALVAQLKSFLKTEKSKDRNVFLALANNRVYATKETVHMEHVQQIRYAGEVLFPASVMPANRWKYKFYADDEHGTIPIPATYDALKFLFQEANLPMKSIIKDPSILDSCYRKLSDQLAMPFIPSQKMYADLAEFAMSRKQQQQAETLVSMGIANYPQSRSLRALQKSMTVN